MGSVKDLEVIKIPTENRFGDGRFIFSDDYSVFDWGKMPDQIPYKGASLCLDGAYFFELMDEKGMPTHYQFLEDKEGNGLNAHDATEPVNRMRIKLVRVIKPEYTEKDDKRVYDYSVFDPYMSNFLIPLEVIYRNGLPTGSSIFKRLKKGEMTPEDLNLDHYPEENEWFVYPKIDFSTKLEEGDRYPSWKERWQWARQISGMNVEETDDMRWLVDKGNRLITRETKRIGLDNWDGKFEFAFDPDGNIIFVDVTGTPDECRFTKGPIIYSKEAGRQYYIMTQPEWVRKIDEAKTRARKEGIKEWKQFVKSRPEPLDPDFKNIMGWIYQSFTNELLGRRIFDAPSIDETAREYTKYLESMK